MSHVCLGITHNSCRQTSFPLFREQQVTPYYYLIPNSNHPETQFCQTRKCFRGSSRVNKYTWHNRKPSAIHVEFFLHSLVLYSIYEQYIPVIVPEVGPSKNGHYKRFGTISDIFVNQEPLTYERVLPLYPIWHYIRWHYNRYALYIIQHVLSSICFAKRMPSCHATFAIRLAGNTNQSFTDMRFMTRGRFSVYVSVHSFCTSYPGVCCKKSQFRNGSPGNPFTSNVSRKYYKVKFA